RKQFNLQQDMKGYQYLSRVWEPWAKHRALQAQFQRLPVTSLDIEILRRFDDMELELSEVDAQRKKLIDEAKRLQKQAEEIKLRPELEEEVCAVKHLFEQSREMQILEQQLSGHSSGVDTRKNDLLHHEAQRYLSQLDGHWDVHRLQA